MLCAVFRGRLYVRGGLGFLLFRCVGFLAVVVVVLVLVLMLLVCVSVLLGKEVPLRVL